MGGGKLQKGKRSNSFVIALGSAACTITLASIAMVGVGLFAKPSNASFITGAVGFPIFSLTFLVPVVLCACFTHGILCKTDDKEHARTVKAGLAGIVSILTIPPIAMVGVGLFAKPSNASFTIGEVGFHIISLVVLAVAAYCASTVYDCILDLKKVNKSLKTLVIQNRNQAKIKECN